MKQELLDNGLKKALQKPMPYRLSTNFTFRTMQKVDEAVRLKERKQERWMLFVTVLTFMVLLAISVLVVTVYWGQGLTTAFQELARSITKFQESESPWGILLVISIFLMLFDHWMRHVYFKRYPKKE